MGTAIPKSGGVRFGGIFDRYKETIQNREKLVEEVRKKIIAWDVAPEQAYFDELFRISRDQIIWGGNYFTLPPTRCFLIWKKLTISESFSMAMAEYAWTSFTGNAKIFEAAPQGNAKEERFHPTQKPIALYSWILSKYAKPGMKILDTHVGSASSLIACHRAGLDYWGFEIDPGYYERAKERLEKEKAQINLFTAVQEHKQESFL
jgi:site-specific DNA-methyltransferase (adenine-specific)